MKVVFFAALFFLFTGFTGTDLPQVDKEEAKRAYELINKIRSSPKDYSKQLRVNLNSINPRPALIWNDTLAKVAEQRALDMASRNYFNHVDPSGYAANYYINKGGYKLNPEWLKRKKENGFESIQAGADSCTEAIRELIIDKGVSSLGHRYHLLGVGEWNASLVDIGIGFVRAPEKSKYETYTCVIIAKHNW